MELSSQEKQQLLSLARFSIQSAFYSDLAEPQLDKDNLLYKSKSGSFVTLTIDRKLRGCIGYIQSQQELYKTIAEAAYQAAFYDPRFSPLTENEYENISIEISILSEPFPLESYDEIIIGTHGLIVEEEGRKGLLLPQVPIEHKMSKDEYLSAICNKAGLYSEYWKEKQLNLKAFTATVFSEANEDLK